MSIKLLEYILLGLSLTGMFAFLLPSISLYEISLQREDVVFCERGTLHFGAGFHRVMGRGDEVGMSTIDRLHLMGNKTYGVI